MYQGHIQLSSDVINTYTYRVGGPIRFPYEFIFLIGIKLIVGLALLYGTVKLFKTKKFRDIISKI